MNPELNDVNHLFAEVGMRDGAYRDFAHEQARRRPTTREAQPAPAQPAAPAMPAPSVAPEVTAAITAAGDARLRDVFDRLMGLPTEPAHDEPPAPPSLLQRLNRLGMP